MQVKHHAPTLTHMYAQASVYVYESSTQNPDKYAMIYQLTMCAHVQVQLDTRSSDTHLKRWRVRGFIRGDI